MMSKLQYLIEPHCVILFYKRPISLVKLENYSYEIVTSILKSLKILIIKFADSFLRENYSCLFEREEEKGVRKWALIWYPFFFLNPFWVRKSWSTRKWESQIKSKKKSRLVLIMFFFGYNFGSEKTTTRSTLDLI